MLIDVSGAVAMSRSHCVTTTSTPMPTSPGLLLVDRADVRMPLQLDEHIAACSLTVSPQRCTFAAFQLPSSVFHRHNAAHSTSSYVNSLHPPPRLVQRSLSRSTHH